MISIFSSDYRVKGFIFITRYPLCESLVAGTTPTERKSNRKKNSTAIIIIYLN